MGQNGNYIKLPSLKSIEVNDYTLFKNSWSYRVKDGLNLFLGINELGKTTTANMIIYGLVGLYEDITPKYFKSRAHTDGKTEPTVALTFKIGNESLHIKRKLFSRIIDSFKVGRQQYTLQDNANIDEIYKDTLLRLTGISDINDLSFLLRYLLIREEEGNFLLWDQERQSKVLRLLLNHPKFDSEFEDLTEKVRTADSKVRDTQYYIGQLRNDLAHTEILKNKRLEKDVEYTTIKQLENELSLVTVSIAALRERKLAIRQNITYISDNLINHESESEGLAADIDRAIDELRALEKQLFESIYTSPKVALAAHKFSKYKICMFCDHEIEKSNAERITRIIEDEKHCPVCASKISVSKPKPNADDATIQDIEKLRTKIIELNDQSAKLKDSIKVLSADRNREWAMHNETDLNLKDALIKQENLKISKAAAEEGKEDLSISYDTDIRTYRGSIEDKEVEMNKAKSSKSKYESKLKEKNDDLSLIINSFSKQLNVIFNKYVSEYFRADCLLKAIEGNKSKEYRTKLTTFFPKFDDQDRQTQDSVSTSERIFLESIFRLSIIELYHRITSIAPFIVMETSEGPFDIISTDRFAAALNKFSENHFPFISITNLSKPDFVKKLINGYDNPAGRTLKFLDFCHLSAEQKQNIKKYLQIQETILGKE